MNLDWASLSPEERDARITSLLLGELAPAEAEELRRIIDSDTELSRACQRRERTIALLREAACRQHPAGEISGKADRQRDAGGTLSEAAATAAPARLSDERRQKLLERFKSAGRKQRARKRLRIPSWSVPMSIAAILVGLLVVAVTELGNIGPWRSARARARAQHVSLWRAEPRSFNVGLYVSDARSQGRRSGSMVTPLPSYGSVNGRAGESVSLGIEQRHGGQADVAALKGAVAANDYLVTDLDTIGPAGQPSVPSSKASTSLAIALPAATDADGDHRLQISGQMQPGTDLGAAWNGHEQLVEQTAGRPIEVARKTAVDRNRSGASDSAAPVPSTPLVGPVVANEVMYEHLPQEAAIVLGERITNVLTATFSESAGSMHSAYLVNSDDVNGLAGFPATAQKPFAASAADGRDKLALGTNPFVARYAQTVGGVESRRADLDLDYAIRSKDLAQAFRGEMAPVPQPSTAPPASQPASVYSMNAAGYVDWDSLSKEKPAARPDASGRAELQSANKLAMPATGASSVGSGNGRQDVAGGFLFADVYSDGLAVAPPVPALQPMANPAGNSQMEWGLTPNKGSGAAPEGRLFGNFKTDDGLVNSGLADSDKVPHPISPSIPNASGPGGPQGGTPPGLGALYAGVSILNKPVTIDGSAGLSKPSGAYAFNLNDSEGARGTNALVSADWWGSQDTGVEMFNTAPSGPGTASFWWKVQDGGAPTFANGIHSPQGGDIALSDGAAQYGYSLGIGGGARNSFSQLGDVAGAGLGFESAGEPGLGFLFRKTAGAGPASGGGGGRSGAGSGGFNGFGGFGARPRMAIAGASASTAGATPKSTSGKAVDDEPVGAIDGFDPNRGFWEGLGKKDAPVQGQTDVGQLDLLRDLSAELAGKPVAKSPQPAPDGANEVAIRSTPLAELPGKARQMLIEGQILEMPKNPQAVKGINWTGTFAERESNLTRANLTRADGESKTMGDSVALRNYTVESLQDLDAVGLPVTAAEKKEKPALSGSGSFVVSSREEKKLEENVAGGRNVVTAGAAERPRRGDGESSPARPARQGEMAAEFSGQGTPVAGTTFQKISVDSLAAIPADTKEKSVQQTGQVQAGGGSAKPPAVAANGVDSSPELARLSEEVAQLQFVRDRVKQNLELGEIEARTPTKGAVQIIEPATAGEPAKPPTLWGRIGGAFGSGVERSASISVEPDLPDVTPTSASVYMRSPVDPFSVQTEAERIKSKPVLSRVVEKLKLNEAWSGKSSGGKPLSTDEAVNLLKKRLDVGQTANTSLMNIRAKSDNAEEAAQIANTVAETYKEVRNKARTELARNGFASLQQQLTEKEKTIAAKKEELERRRRELNPPQTNASVAKPPASGPIPQPEVLTRDNAFSTFSLNVSDVSFKLAAASLEKGAMPEAASIRSEEFINAFDYRDPMPAPGAPLAFASERARYPFAHNRDVVRFSIKTAAQGREAGKPLNIVVLLDNSGSMERADRVRIIQESLRSLATQLKPQDKLSVVTFARTASLRVDGVSGTNAAEVAKQVGALTPEGGTNLEDALDLAYRTALRHYAATAVNRIVLLTDGAANLGNVDPKALKTKVENFRKQGIALDCFGIGWEGFNDDLLEQLSRNGDGRYGFVNTPEEAASEFVGQLAGALRVAASDVKMQVEFNPKRVTAYRQIGYAKHQLTKEQFRDNKVDAAEIGAAEAGNALYVIETNPNGEGPIATVRARFRVPNTSDYREHEWAVPFGSAVELGQASPTLRLAASASAFSEWLASSPFAGEVTTDRLLQILSGVPETYGADPRPKRLEWMIRQAKSISGK